ncbi:hypothetical protein C8J55DRAFT_608078 [Lentinula edodes]|uniref:Uncharacterized protein n=1 Tax=Lentinula lateritia TaxID=40482 RepID=A0A9W9A0J7_9AGAR|nr:hypothetical protein C8J55DRAFT_608078 [Lentinula edodes]
MRFLSVCLGLMLGLFAIVQAVSARDFGLNLRSVGPPTPNSGTNNHPDNSHQPVHIYVRLPWPLRGDHLNEVHVPTEVVHRFAAYFHSQPNMSPITSPETQIVFPGGTNWGGRDPRSTVRFKWGMHPEHVDEDGYLSRDEESSSDSE